MISYPVALAVLSVLVAAFEFAWPRRLEQKQLRARLWSDFCHLIFNGHWLGVGVYWLATHRIEPPLHSFLAGQGLDRVLFAGVASGVPWWAQIVLVIVVMDFVQWCVHNTLHRVPFLWEFHKIHHSVVDGEMDWIVSFRFHWMEVVVYKCMQYLPLAFFGFSGNAVLAHAMFGTLIGHLNHANLDWGHGPWRYVLNNPRMHLWHHDYDCKPGEARNFGIIFSAWDWIFGTAHVPDHPPRALGFPGTERVPLYFPLHELWPLVKRSG